MYFSDVPKNHVHVQFSINLRWTTLNLYENHEKTSGVWSSVSVGTGGCKDIQEVNLANHNRSNSASYHGLRQRIRLIKHGHLPQERRKKTWNFQRICTGFVASRGQRLGERQRRTAWWARHSKDTATIIWYKRACIRQITQRLSLAVTTSKKDVHKSVGIEQVPN